MKRLAAIEGLRAYLALWVFIDHTMAWCGMDLDNLSGILWNLRDGIHAVYGFMAISGFVIFALLDQRRETYGQFVCRRFFRLYPLFILLFALAVPMSAVTQWILRQPNNYLPPVDLDFELSLVRQAWDHVWANVALHSVMLHGLVPDFALGKNSRLAFLGSAWSISLEWQFYLVAPLLYYMIFKNWLTRGLVFVVVAPLCLLGLHYSWWAPALLPWNLQYFTLGVLSYLAYREFVKNPGWVKITGPESWVTRWALAPVTNPVALALGKISYSIYLVHELVLILVNAGLLRFAPGLSPTAHFWSLLGIGLAVTVAAAFGLYRWVEAPGMELGKRLAKKMASAGSLSGAGLVTAKKSS